MQIENNLAADALLFALAICITKVFGFLMGPTMTARLLKRGERRGWFRDFDYRIDYVSI
jgi:hypothetical protein